MIGMLIISFVEIVYNTNTLLEKIWFTFTYTVSSYYIIKRIPVWKTILIGITIYLYSL
jgi:hypothetical protein